jgi:putative transposase
MTEGSVRMDLRMIVVTWPDGQPRGAVRRFCRANGVSTSWFYEIRRRVLEDGPVVAAVPRSRRPRSSPSRVSVLIEDLAVKARKELAEDGWDCGPITVRDRLLDQGVAAPSVSTLSRIFTDRGLVVPAPQKRPKSSYRRFEYPKVHDCWQLDATEWKLADGAKAVVFQVLDDHSRAILASLVAAGETADAALSVVMLAIERYGPPVLFLTDNGAALNPTRRGSTGLLETYLRSLGVHPITSTPGHPQTCGKDERVHSTYKRWLRARPLAHDHAELQTQTDTFDDYYNNTRRHQALDGRRTPNDALTNDPRADPPTPPEPTAAPTSTKPDHRTRHAKVAVNGNVGAAGHLIQLGREHAHTTVITITDQAIITIFTTDGTHLRTITTEPGRRYYGNGKPPGGTRKRP